MNKYPKRKSMRLKGYNYSQPGYYYVTICTYERKCVFANIIDNNVHLNIAGQMIDHILQTLSEYYPDIIIDNYVVMPNHVHAIIIIKESVGAAPRGRPLINTCLKPNESSNQNNILGNGPAQGPAPTGLLSLSDIIYRFKSLTTKKYIDGVKNHQWSAFNKHLWQRSFHDHIIRNDRSLNAIREYIANNPLNWEQDIDRLINL